MSKKNCNKNRDNAAVLRRKETSVNAERDGSTYDYELLSHCAEILTQFVETKDASIREGMATMVGRNRARTLMGLTHIDGGDRFYEEDGIIVFERQFKANDGALSLYLFIDKVSGNLFAVCQGDNPYSEALFTLAREALGTWLQSEVQDYGRIA